MQEIPSYKVCVEENKKDGYVMHINTIDEVLKLIKKIDKFVEIRINPSKREAQNKKTRDVIAND